METIDMTPYIKKRLLSALAFTILLTAASCNSTDSQFSDENWLISVSEVVDGGPGKDGIPSIDNPDFLDVSEVSFISDERMVLGVRVGNEVRAYPHQVLDWHEIVNDEIDGNHVGIIFCPLTGTGQAWDREVNGSVTEFGVSGLLYRNNLIAYDRNTDSNWSQMQLRSVNGDLMGLNVETYPVVETNWATWKQMYPDTKVHSTNTGFSRNYSGFTYGSDFSTNHNRILFPIRNNDNRLQRKVRVLGIIDSSTGDHEAVVKAYPVNRFESGIEIVYDRVGLSDYVIVGSSSSDISAAFHNRLDDGTVVSEFTAIQGALPVVMEDPEGNRYDIFGYVVEGPDLGMKLEHARSYMGYWYGWTDFFPNIEIYGDNN
jgi:hypothetical protein